MYKPNSKPWLIGFMALFLMFLAGPYPIISNDIIDVQADWVDDKDGDGTIDLVDDCPETPGPMWNNGCPSE